MTPDDLEPLAKELQSLLQVERVAPAASAVVKARMLERISGELFAAGALGGGGGGHSGGAAAPAAAAGAKAVAWGTAAVAKLAIGVGVAAFAVGGFVGAGVHAISSAPPPTRSPVVVAPSPVVVAPVEVVAPAPVPVPVPEPVKPALVRPVKAVEKSSDTLGEERSYLEQARSAMARRDAAAALNALAEHERRFPSGQLAEERMALQVLGLAGGGRGDEARALAIRFRSKYPASLLRGAVDAAAP